MKIQRYSRDEILPYLITDKIANYKSYSIKYCASFDVDILEDKIAKLEAENKQLKDALLFYADPGTYFAIGFFPDPPCGDFMNDFSDTVELGRKPGKRAREVLGYTEVIE